MSNYVLDEAGARILEEVDTNNTSFILEENQDLAMTCVLTWNANTEPNLVSYNVYHGVTSGVYYEHVNVLAPTTTYTWTDLYNWTPHFFAITAVNSVPLESAFSNEVMKTMFFKKYTHLGIGAASA